ncbi:MAG: ATP-dependent RNA helicase [uncultured Nocardioidaceae bacterium]|uniref:RNA helicase n=1 Tax=uncultured Nocardioidaceae bacterium TaxID=253824 RepID=A0A6J4MZ71_9ACTN|nr:MAG: ATP-dependent RNA helicase [uncultured Nocardioidaceae bacterium]
MPAVVQALRAADITDAFPIQEMALPIALTGTDLIGQARTGTGKTLAFAIPIQQRVIAPRDPDFEELVAPGKPQALVIAPTRELALQVAGDLALTGKQRGTRTVTVYGGVPYEGQLDALASGVDIVVGTPGRLLDLANRRALDLSHVKVLVLDEADEMLDLGFLPDVERLIAKTPELRQTMLFSATMRGEVIGLARTHMRHPVNVRAESATDALTVPATAQFVYQVHDLDKMEILARVMQAENRGLSIIFTRTKRQAQRVAEDLMDRGFPAAPLHGDMAQVAREKALKRFRSGTVEILVATDVAARGIDVEGVTHVINYSCPEDEKTYIHRIGRTGRAGASGAAITFVDWADLTRWKMINRLLDLPYDSPAETYSTSESLFHDQGIPAGTKGRVGEPAPRDEAGNKEPRLARSGDKPRGDAAKSQGRPSRGRTRQRSRTRSGQRVEGGRQPAAEGSGSSGAEKAGSSPDTADGPPRSRSRARRRRRTRSGAPATSGSD